MAGQADPGPCSLNMLVIAMLWLASAGHGRVVSVALSGPICRECPFLQRAVAGRPAELDGAHRARSPFRRGCADVRLDDGER
jgi:hypothetical protein